MEVDAEPLRYVLDLGAYAVELLRVLSRELYTRDLHVFHRSTIPNFN
jgi:hypothetical protein